MAVPDRGHTLLLSSLGRSNTTETPLSTIQALIVHYLANIYPSPTPLAATIVSSPIFIQFSLSKLEVLSTSFRHAVHSKLQVLKADSSGLFSPSLDTQLNVWSLAIFQGLEGGHAIIRLACCSGLLLGLEDILQHLPAKMRGVKGIAEDELVMTFADVIDQFSTSDTWRKEFHSAAESADALALSLIICSQSLLLAPSQKFTALPLSHLLGLIMRTIEDAFDGGRFLSSLQSSLCSKAEFKIHIPSDSPISKSIKNVSNSNSMAYIGSISKLCARTMSLFVDHRPNIALPLISEAYQKLNSITAHVETDWFPTSLSGATGQSLLSPDAREVTTVIWATLKTLLFSVIMITEAGLSALVYIPSTSAVLPSTSTLAAIVLQALSHLSFVITQFGGAGYGAFDELKRLFYLALDILGSDVTKSNEYARHLCVVESGLEPHPAHPFYQAKRAFALSAIEQLIPVLNEMTIQELVFPTCLPHLSDASHRETFESAHSVVLAIFASHAQKARESTSQQGGGFTRKIVPFYANCLIDNSVQGRLSTLQLRLAFAALVRSAASAADLSLAWFCIDCLLAAVASVSKHDNERKHRLHLTLISCVPSVPLALLPRLLDPIRSFMDAAQDEKKRQELIDALFAEIKVRVGDREKEYIIRWWGELRMKWAHTVPGREEIQGDHGLDTEVTLTPRL
ncbi:uncharacterized protein BJ212DRAFT_1328449 [Suillus subaureus]|uniref:Uncharacterized protein n=1 Tax=Suillus subaureus TaxID=48587 RepID=A0A9P7EJB2_9AGAM|nr:uncharacterized protein BJ212DRAFT_1328449 [Suillus subaureus]KAG1822504.1 hypothetical protein BJ212DRAFT_1328449 [Suillus subaureus]